jgi:zinc protease
VVKNEVKVNVLNQPYGGFPWLDMPQYANENWYNAHNFYGDLNDLDSANLEDVKTFFDTFYAPNNAVITVVGDFQPQDARKWIQKYFAHIPSTSLPPLPDLTEPKQTVERKFTKEDKLANRPAIAIAYKMPARNTPEYYAMGIINQILVNGNDSKLFQKLVQEKGYTGGVEGGINYLGNMYNYNGPMIWMCNLLYDKTLSADSIIHQMDVAAAEIQNITPEEVDVAIIKIRSALYDEIGGSFGIGRADLLSCFALFDDDPSRINNIENEFRKITPEIVKKTANQYLIPSNRTILIIDPKATTL